MTEVTLTSWGLTQVSTSTSKPWIPQGYKMKTQGQSITRASRTLSHSQSITSLLCICLFSTKVLPWAPVEEALPSHFWLGAVWLKSFFAQVDSWNFSYASVYILTVQQDRQIQALKLKSAEDIKKQGWEMLSSEDMIFKAGRPEKTKENGLETQVPGAWKRKSCHYRRAPERQCPWGGASWPRRDHQRRAPEGTVKGTQTWERKGRPSQKRKWNPRSKDA